MYWEKARHPRAGIAIGASVLGLWVGAVGVGFATDNSGDGDRSAAAAGDSEQTPSARPGVHHPRFGHLFLDR
jgi:hypothetical protein